MKATVTIDIEEAYESLSHIDRQIFIASHLDDVSTTELVEFLEKDKEVKETIKAEITNKACAWLKKAVDTEFIDAYECNGEELVEMFIKAMEE